MTKRMDRVTEEAWKDFGDSGMLWLCNRVSALFGWQLRPEIMLDGEIVEVVPVKLPYAAPKLETLQELGILDAYLKDNMSKITEDLE